MEMIASGLGSISLPGRGSRRILVMDMNEYMLEVVARDRLAELREVAQRSHWPPTARPVAHPVRVALGRALIRIGRRLQGVNERSVGKIDAGGSVVARRKAAHGGVRG
jgi:hypothetical protein